MMGVTVPVSSKNKWAWLKVIFKYQSQQFIVDTVPTPPQHNKVFASEASCGGNTVLQLQSVTCGLYQACVCANRVAAGVLYFLHVTLERRLTLAP